MQLAIPQANYDFELFNQFLNESSRAAQQQLSGDRLPTSTKVNSNSDQNVPSLQRSINTSAIQRQQALLPANSHQLPMGYSAADQIGKMAIEQPQHLLRTFNDKQRQEFKNLANDSNTVAKVSALETSSNQGLNINAFRKFSTPSSPPSINVPSVSLPNNLTSNAADAVLEVDNRSLQFTPTTTPSSATNEDPLFSNIPNGISQSFSHQASSQPDQITEHALPNVSKAMQQAIQHRAKMVTFAVNGKPFSPQIRIALLAKEFPQLSHLLDHLTQRLGYAVRYLFDLSGHRINSTSLLQHNRAYVASSSARFQPANYARFGQLGSTGFGSSHSSLG